MHVSVAKKFPSLPLAESESLPLLLLLEGVVEKYKKLKTLPYIMVDIQDSVQDSYPGSCQLIRNSSARATSVPLAAA